MYDLSWIRIEWDFLFAKPRTKICQKKPNKWQLFSSHNHFQEVSMWPAE